MSRVLVNKVINNLELMQKVVAEAASKIFQIEEKNHMELMAWVWNLSKWYEY